MKQVVQVPRIISPPPTNPSDDNDAGLSRKTFRGHRAEAHICLIESGGGGGALVVGGGERDRGRGRGFEVEIQQASRIAEVGRIRSGALWKESKRRKIPSLGDSFLFVWYRRTYLQATSKTAPPPLFSTYRGSQIVSESGNSPAFESTVSPPKLQSFVKFELFRLEQWGGMVLQ